MGQPTGGFFRAENVAEDFNAKVQQLIFKMLHSSMLNDTFGGFAGDANKDLIRIQQNPLSGNRGNTLDYRRNRSNFTTGVPAPPPSFPGTPAPKSGPGPNGIPTTLAAASLGGVGTLTNANTVVAAIRAQMDTYAEFQLVKLQSNAAESNRRNAGMGFTQRWPTITVQVVGHAPGNDIAARQAAMQGDITTYVGANSITGTNPMDANDINGLINECQRIWFEHCVSSIPEGNMATFTASYCHNNHNSHSSHGSRSRR